jgi:hypothetical protein
MWLEAGDEACRCGRRGAWVMGDPFGLARVYCEEHGRQIRRVAGRAGDDRAAHSIFTGSKLGDPDPGRYALPESDEGIDRAVRMRSVSGRE